MLHSTPIPHFYQVKPLKGGPRNHGNSWKNLYGHDLNMEMLRQRHDLNQKAVTYKLAGTIIILHDQTLDDVRKTLAKIDRKLREKNVVYWHVKEIAKRTNRIHYHVIVASDHDPDDVKKWIRDSNKHLNFRLQFDPIKNSKWWANYLCKSTTFRGRPSFHARKVLLFAIDNTLDKHNATAGFWHPSSVLPKPTKEEKQAKRDYAHRLREAGEDSLVQDAVQHLADALGLNTPAPVPEVVIVPAPAPVPEKTVITDGIDWRAELEEALLRPTERPAYYNTLYTGFFLERYAKNLVADPTEYQSYADDAREYRIAELNSEPDREAHDPTTPRHRTFDRYIVNPFAFSPTPIPSKPPVRVKKTPKPPFPAFDPTRCESVSPVSQ